MAKAAEKAGILTLIESLPEGFQTTIGEAGRGLSGGEKQRLALARAFLKKPSVILFDEPTTGLDLQTERILQASMKELAKTSTVITVAHRLHTIKKADSILLLESGELIARGKHEELVEAVPAYREMVSVQQGGSAG
jgi:ATP-binding cassette, subfamily C, bacterial CydD